MKRLGLFATTAALAGLVLVSGCTRPNPSPEADGITLEFWTLQMQPFEGYIRDRIARYEKAHPGVRIRWVDVPMSEGEKKALTSMLANRTPDVINLNPDFSAILASRDALVDMNRAVPAEVRASYLPVAWQAASQGKETFGLPWYLSSAVTLYNKALFKQAGLEGPPATKAELATMARRFRDKKAGYLLLPTLGTGGRFFRTLLKADVPLWDASGKHLVFADHGADRELAFWVDLFRQNLVPREALTEDPQAAVDRYQSRTLGMLLTGPNFLKIVKENAPKTYAETGVAPQFPTQSRYMDFSEMLLVVPKRARHPKEAVDFALAMTSAESTERLSALAPVLPPHTTSLQSLAGITDKADIMSPARAMSARQLLLAKTAMQVHPMQKRLNELMDFYVQSALLGRLTPKAAMDKAQREMNDLIR